MKRNACWFLLLFFTSFQPSLLYASRPDSLLCKNLITADLLPLYYNFFDSKIQYRLGAGYSNVSHNDYFISHHLDFGIYDHYTFTKYYNLFGENSGLYYVEKNVFISGFHYMPSFNVYLVRTHSSRLNSIFSGIAIDFSFYHKQTSYFNSSNNDEWEMHYRQIRTGAGLQAGSRYQLTSRWFTEMKILFFSNIMCYSDDNDSEPIRSLPALWTRYDYKFWLSANICVGYVIN
jgi:hypothetical protein